MWPLVLSLALAQVPPLGADAADPLLCATTEEMAKAAGYAVEAHEVRTADGYLVRLERLVGGRPGGQPALLLHGLFCASDLWLLRGPGAALGYLLADDGYDVWLMNFRGNRYSARHTTLNTTDPSFWKFSWHEMAVWDLPATIDHVLAVTGWRQLQAVGHSMGNTALLAMLASRPQYSRKLALGSLLAPVAYIHTFRVPFSHFLLADWRHIQSLLQRARIYRVPPTTKESCSLLQKTCGDDKPTQDLCLNLIQTLYGWDPQGLNKSALPFYLSHMFAGVSVDTIAHFAQIIKSGRFEAMDRGPEENFRRYGSTRPPAYHLQRIDAPLALYYADNDYELHPKGVMQLAKELQNVVSIERVPETAFNHIDFLLHKRVLSLLYSSVMAVMQRFRHSIAANISP
ncbi:lipase 1-like [Schistocerca cancellata]|uniref:lipase 1-like n=1 Tax=Schistocerca cancellata TaxID=274614 RepID=UPI002118EE74|nr:lipase 1-like [Schistocerca cancellata]